MAKYREYGQEQPYIPLGIFKVRFPFIHYRWEISEMFQAILMCATCLGAIPILEDVLGIPYDVAWSMVIINGVGYILHATLGDPVVPGWITPAIPLITAFLTSSADVGPERIQYLIALQLMIAFVFIFMGTTGLANRLLSRVPNSIKAGILLAAGLSATIGEMRLEGRFNKYPITLGITVIVSYYLLFSESFKKLKKSNKYAVAIGKYGMLPSLILAVILGPLFKEIGAPKVEMGSIFKLPDIKSILQLVSPFGVGFPGLSKFIAAIPTTIMVYIIAFGDFVTSESLINEADEIRQDEKIDFNPNRSNLVSGIRNLVQAFISPYVPLCGPLWAAVTAAVATRYQDGRKAMDSIFSGAGTFRIMTLIGVATIPIVSLVKPALPVALSLTLIVQGYVCVRLAMQLCVSGSDAGIAGIMAAVIISKNSAWGLAVGVILYIVIHGVDFKKEDELSSSQLKR